MRKTKEEAEITRQNLLKAALVVFSRQGYNATRLEDIADEAGVTRGAIYHHFGGKAELFNTLAGEYSSSRITPVIESALKEGGSPLEMLRLLLVRVMEYVEIDTDFRAITELVLFKTGSAPELAEGMQRKIESNRALLEYLAQFVQQGIDTGEVRPDVNPMDAAIGLYGLLSGVSTLWLMDTHHFSIRERAANLIDIGIRGIAAT